MSTSTGLTREKVIEIRKLLRQGVRQVDIAKQFGISQPTVSRIKWRQIWPHAE